MAKLHGQAPWPSQLTGQIRVMETSTTCLNCGHGIEGPFCSQCGQRAREPRGPLLDLLRDFLGAVLNLDSRFLGSLLTLVREPGRLTERYLAGQRAALLPPVRMYLVLSLVLFFFIEIPVPNAQKYNVYVGGQLIGRDVEDPSLGYMNVGTNQEGEALPWLEDIFVAKEERLQQMDPQHLLDAIFQGIEGNLSKALILFIPLLALILKILYLGSGRLYYDHVIFSLHAQSFLFLLIILCWCFSWLTSWAFLALLYSPVYLGLAMKRVYRQSWLRSMFKLGILLASYVFTLLWVLGMTFAYLILQI